MFKIRTAFNKITNEQEGAVFANNSFMSWIWSEHIAKQIGERKIPKKHIELCLSKPDAIQQSLLFNRLIYQKMIDHKLLRVIVENNILVTAYFTDKIDKYLSKRGT
jgi:hypothetical protein